MVRSDTAPLPNAAPMLVAAELMLGLVGAALAWWQDIPLGARMTPQGPDLLWAAASLAPMLGILLWAHRSRWRPIARLRRQVQQIVDATLAGAAGWELALVAAAAGLGEEVLFRGALQSIAAQSWSPTASVLVVSLLFGAAHAASVTYFAVATLVGVYLGWLALASPSLLVPILVHAFYDWIALVLIRGRKRRR